jgi:hypothetical protein
MTAVPSIFQPVSTFTVSSQSILLVQLSQTLVYLQGWCMCAIDLHTVTHAANVMPLLSRTLKELAYRTSDMGHFPCPNSIRHHGDLNGDEAM